MRRALTTNLAIMALRDLVSKRVRLVLNLLGVVIGVSALLFLLSLTEGIRRTVLTYLVGSIPITEMTASPAEAEEHLGWLERQVAKKAGARRAEDLVVKKPLRGDITDETIETVRQIPGVARVYGIRTLKRVPTRVEGWILGLEQAHFFTEAVVYAYPAALLAGDVKDVSDYYFRPDGACDGLPISENLDDAVNEAVLRARMDIADVDGRYVPVVLSRKLVHAYNLSYAGTGERGLLPKIGEDSFVGQYMYIRLGVNTDFVQGQDETRAKGALLKVIGLSDRVEMLALSVPPQYIEVWEKAYFRDPVPIVYQELIVQARSVADVEPVRQALLPVGERLAALRAERGLSVEEAAQASGLGTRVIQAIEAGTIRRTTADPEARKAVRRYATALRADPDEMEAAFTRALDMHVESQKETIDKINSVTTFVRFAFVLVVAIILGITAVGILNVLTMSVYEERVDIGILRSVGARQSHVRFIYLLKAFMIGLIGSIAGLLLGWAAMRGGDALARVALPFTAYMPASFFIAQWEFVVLSLAMGIGFALLAGISPANYAAKLNPSKALRRA
jgi:ABC-type lipoprotein release transport system permease subunit